MRPLRPIHPGHCGARRPDHRGLKRSAIGTVVERTHEVHDAEGIGCPARTATAPISRTKNGPPLGWLRRVTMKNALTASMATLPDQLAIDHLDLGPRQKSSPPTTNVHRRDRCIPVFFADPRSPWQPRHQREHQRPAAPILPVKGTDLHRGGARDRPRRCAVAAGDQRRATPQDPRLEDTQPRPRPAPTLRSTSRCCFDRLNPVAEPWSEWAIV